MAIVMRGMGNLLQPNSDNAREGTLLHIARENSYDPMLSANWMITGNAISVAGMDMMMCDDCPICTLNTEDWIDQAADQQLEEANSRGLLLIAPLR